MPEETVQRLRPVWIASYPRSGNTFLRILLEQAFQLASYSLYNLEGQQHHDPSADALEHAPLLPPDWRQRTAPGGEGQLTLIKTHGPPEDDAPAIYLVRDGRAAIDSYFHYHQKFGFEQPSLVEVIAGACQFGSWSRHVRAWRPAQRPRTLFLRYEELVARPLELIPRLAGFLERAPVGGRVPTFVELQQRLPAFFRRGASDSYLSEWTPGHLAFFNQLHGATMGELGYDLVPGAGPEGSLLEELAASAARLHDSYLEQLGQAGSLVAAVDELERKQERLTQEKAELAEHARRLDETLNARWVRLGLALGLVRRDDPGKRTGGA